MIVTLGNSSLEATELGPTSLSNSGNIVEIGTASLTQQYGLWLLRNHEAEVILRINDLPRPIAFSEQSICRIDDKLLLCMGCSAVCLSLSALKLHWQVFLDESGVFKVYPLQDESKCLFLGELSLSLLEISGNVKWQVFFSETSLEVDNVSPHEIIVKGFEGIYWKVDFDSGEILDSWKIR